MNSETKNLTLSALIITLGIVIPIAFHAVGIGSVFLPMYWPLAAGAFLLIPRWALITGFLTPTLSFALTGMPPVSPPVLPLMIVELCILTFTVSYLNHKKRIGLIIILLIGLVLSKLILLLAAWLISPVIGLPPELISLSALIHGLPGTVVILIIVPFIIKRITYRDLI